ncbi:adenine phosphoribosyltransferase [Platysternon megacephalum]|uniref:Adenine phosphoribosyltransferase n=1 Tax=Platysternon megacephalum TaxID=55544 RepID=A0A4D9DJG3_9SAUR|nr:adenine phosphoribosyltransferase [Platysternon megacephalum]
MRFPTRQHRVRERLAAISLTVLAFAVPGTAPATAQPAPTPQPRIIDGHLAEFNPGLISMGEPGTHDCTGSIIAPTWVLTANHCVHPDTVTKHQIRYGTLAHAKGTIVNIAQTHRNIGADLALLRLATPITDTAPVRLAHHDPNTGDDLTLWGWGKTTPDGPASDVLKYAFATVQGLRPGDDNNATVIELTGKTGTPWKGDSGGPAFALVDGAPVQVGVCSTGRYQHKTSTYVSITAYRAWIHSIAGV